jgi:hypothetical protein
MASIKGRTTPNVCVYRVIAWIHVAVADIDLPPDQASLAFGDLTTKVLDRLLKWLTMLRTRADLDSFVSLDCQCTITQRDDANHRRGEHEHTKSDQRSDKPCWYLLSLCLRAPNVFAFRNDPCPDLRRMNKVRHRIAWPYSVRRLLPHGPHKTLDGVLQWSILPLEPRHRTRFYWLLNVLLRFCHPAILPDFLASELFFFGGLKELTNQAEETFAKNGGDGHVDACIDVVSCLAAVLGLMSILVSVYMNETQTWLFHGAHPAPLLQAYGRILNICRDKPKNKSRPARYGGMRWSSSINQRQVSRIAEMTMGLGHKLIEDCGEMARPNSPSSLHPSFKEYLEKIATLSSLCL